MDEKTEPNKRDNHGLPYPLESTIPAGPADRTQEKPNPGREKILYLDHVGNNADPFTALAYIDTLLLIDDSDSMQQSWDEVNDILRLIAPICIAHAPNGISLEFVHHRARGHLLTGRTGYQHIGLMKGNLDMRDSVAGIYHNVKPKGNKCQMDKRLASILDPYIQDYEARVKQSGGKSLPRPLSVIVVSDMAWDDDQFRFEAIARAARTLDTLGAPRYQVGVQFFRVGDVGRRVDDRRVGFVDDGIWKRRGVRDMVDVTTWTGKPGELSRLGTVKVLLGGVRRSVDYMEV